jgi:hypothetical protein
MEEEKLTERLSLAVDHELVKAIDDWRRVQPDIPTRAGAARLLIKQGLSRYLPATDPAPAKRKRANT